jgi:WD domain, G-beta repeat
VRIWDTTTGAVLSVLEGHTDAVKSVSWSRDGSRLASGSADGTVRVWTADGNLLRLLEDDADEEDGDFNKAKELEQKQEQIKADDTAAVMSPYTFKPGTELHSSDGNQQLKMQSDGNFVIYTRGRATFALQQAGVPWQNPGRSVTLTSEGTLLTSDGYCSGNGGGSGGPYRLEMHNSGVLNIVDSAGSIVWASNSSSKWRRGDTPAPAATTGSGGGSGTGTGASTGAGIGAGASASAMMDAMMAIQMSADPMMAIQMAANPMMAIKMSANPMMAIQMSAMANPGGYDDDGDEEFNAERDYERCLAMMEKDHREGRGGYDDRGYQEDDGDY